MWVRSFAAVVGIAVSGIVTIGASPSSAASPQAPSLSDPWTARPADASPAGSRAKQVGDFSIALQPSTATAIAGQAATFTIISTVTSGNSQLVALDHSTLPAGATASFDPPTISAGGTSQLVVRTSISTRPGTFTITVTGTGAVAVRRASATLVVRAPSAIRAAFYYPWFPEAWNQQGLKPFTNYRPTRGLYAVDVTTVRAQVAEMRYGHITLGIASWFGQGTTTDRHWPALMSGAQGTGFTWAPYYEPEGIANPTPRQIANDLHYLRATYGGTRSPLAILPDRGMPVFVYNADESTTAKGCDTVNRWNQARQILQRDFGETVYIDLKVFRGYATCSGTPSIDGWHQYGPASAEHDFSRAPGDGSFTISPGFWKAGKAYGATPFLARDRGRWRSNIARMNAAGSEWQLITTYNEWGEGTSVESSSGCRYPVPAGTYCNWSGGDTTSDLIVDLHNAPPG